MRQHLPGLVVKGKQAVAAHGAALRLDMLCEALALTGTRLGCDGGKRGLSGAAGMGSAGGDVAGPPTAVTMGAR